MPRPWSRLAEQAQHRIPVGEDVGLSPLLLGEGDAGAVGQHVAERDGVFAILSELGDVLHNPIVDVQAAALVEQVDKHPRHSLRSREDADRGRGIHDLLGAVDRVSRVCAGGMADRPLDDHLSATPEAERDGWLVARTIVVEHLVPDGVDAFLGHPCVARVTLGGVVDTDCVGDVVRNREPMLFAGEVPQNACDHRFAPLHCRRFCGPFVYRP